MQCHVGWNLRLKCVLWAIGDRAAGNKTFVGERESRCLGEVNEVDKELTYVIKLAISLSRSNLDTAMTATSLASCTSVKEHVQAVRRRHIQGAYVGGKNET
jgi:hypothetical protein